MASSGYLVAPYDLTYMASALDSMVPLCLLGPGRAARHRLRPGRHRPVRRLDRQPGRHGFGVAVGQWHWPLLPALALPCSPGAVLGAVNGFLIAYLGFPALIATLATYYAYGPRCC